MPGAQNTQSHESQTRTTAARRRRTYSWDRVKHAAYRGGDRHVGPLLDVLGGLHGHYPTGACVHPSQAKMAERLGCSRRTVIYQLALLESVLLVVVYRSRPRKRADGTYTRATNRYRPAVDVANRLLQHGTAGRAYVQPVAPMSPDGDENRPGAAPSSAPPPPGSGSAPPDNPPAPSDSDGDTPENDWAGPTDAGRAAIAAARQALKTGGRR